MTSISPISSMNMTWHEEKSGWWGRGWRKDNQGNYVILITGHRDNIVDWIMLQNPNEWHRNGALGFKYVFSPQLETAFLLRWG